MTTTPDARSLPLATPCGTCDHARNWHNIDRCVVHSCGCGLFTAPTADRQARRDALLHLTRRMLRGVLLPSERDLLATHVEETLRDGDQAREQLAEAEQRAADAEERERETDREARDARRGEAEAVRAREAAEQLAAGARRRSDGYAERLLAHHADARRNARKRAREVSADYAGIVARRAEAEAERDEARHALKLWTRAAGQERERAERADTEARRNRDAWRNARKRAASLGRQLTDMTADCDGWWARALDNGETLGRRAELAEATLTAVRALLPDNPRDDKWTDHVTAAAVRAALGDPQPASEPDDADRIVAYRLRTGRGLRCLSHAPNPAGADWEPVTSDDLPDGGICTACGADVLIKPEVLAAACGPEAQWDAAAPEPECTDPQGCDKVVPCIPGCAVNARALDAAMAAVREQPAEPLRCSCAGVGFGGKGDCPVHDVKPEQSATQPPTVHVHLDNRGAVYHPWPQEWRAQPAEPLADAVAELADAYRAYLERRRAALAEAMRTVAAAFRAGGSE